MTTLIAGVRTSSTQLSGINSQVTERRRFHDHGIGRHNELRKRASFEIGSHRVRFNRLSVLYGSQWCTLKATKYTHHFADGAYHKKTTWQRQKILCFTTRQHTCVSHLSCSETTTSSTTTFQQGYIHLMKAKTQLIATWAGVSGTKNTSSPVSIKRLMHSQTCNIQPSTQKSPQRRARDGKICTSGYRGHKPSNNNSQ